MERTEPYFALLNPTHTEKRQNIEYGGFHRAIISRNPQLVDEDGYEVESDDEDERSRRAIAAAAEFDPYAIIRLERKCSCVDLPDFV